MHVALYIVASLLHRCSVVMRLHAYLQAEQGETALCAVQEDIERGFAHVGHLACLVLWLC